MMWLTIIGITVLAAVAPDARVLAQWLLLAWIATTLAWLGIPALAKALRDTNN
jgi:hypothetical protein